MSHRRLTNLTGQQKLARRNGDRQINLTANQKSTLRRQGLLAHSHEWYSSPSGTFALAPGDSSAPWGEGRRKRIDVEAARTITDAA